jgi:peptide deformylase
MTTRPILMFDDPVLRRRADPVGQFDRELVHLVRDLRDTMVEAGGVGLAAPQIGVSLRVFCYVSDDEVGHLVNPTITVWSPRQVTDREGCLSFPDIYFPVPRAERVVVSGVDVHGEPVTVDADVRLARCLQHEVDHLDGILFVDRMDPSQRSEAMRLVRAARAQGDPVPTIRTSPHRVRAPGQ